MFIGKKRLLPISVYTGYITPVSKRDVPSIKENGNSPPKKQLGDMKGF